MFDTVVSVNPEGISIEADKKVFQLHASAKKKNGKLVALNELKSFVNHSKEERKKALEEIKEREKWLKKNIELLDEYKELYRTRKTTDEEKEKIKKLVESYPSSFDKRLETMEEYEPWGRLRLMNMISFIDENRNFFEEVTLLSISNKASELYDAILHFDYMNILHERSKDLIQLVYQKRFKGSIAEDEFIRTATEIKKQKEKRPGTETPSELLDDINSILEEVIDNPEFLKKNGELNIKKTIEDQAYNHPMFVKNWVDEETAKENDGYGYRQLHTLFSEEYRKMKG